MPVGCPTFDSGKLTPVIWLQDNWLRTFWLPTIDSRINWWLCPESIDLESNVRGQLSWSQMSEVKCRADCPCPINDAHWQHYLRKFCLLFFVIKRARFSNLLTSDRGTPAHFHKHAAPGDESETDAICDQICASYLWVRTNRFTSTKNAYMQARNGALFTCRHPLLMIDQG